MQPNLLFLPCRIRRRPQNHLHLIDTRERNRPSHKPANTFPARWTRQAPLVRPELVDTIDSIQRKFHIHRHILDHGRFDCPCRLSWGDIIAWNSGGPGNKRYHLRKLGEERHFGRARIQADGKDGDLVACFIDVDKMHLGFAAIATDRVVGWSVDMPAFKVGCHVVIAH